MIIVSGQLSVDPQDAERARDLVRDLVQATRSETGCLAYNFAEDVMEAALFRFYEEWEDEPSLEAHGKTAHLSHFRQELGRLRVDKVQANAHTVSGSRSLM